MVRWQTVSQVLGTQSPFVVFDVLSVACCVTPNWVALCQSRYSGRRMEVLDCDKLFICKLARVRWLIAPYCFHSPLQVSDYGISQFRFLKVLLLCHGRWCYRRMSLVVLYMFYKNLFVLLPVFYFAFLCLYSGISFCFAYLWKSRGEYLCLSGSELLLIVVIRAFLYRCNSPAFSLCCPFFLFFRPAHVQRVRLSTVQCDVYFSEYAYGWVDIACLLILLCGNS